MKYKCDKCKAVFDQRYMYENHINRKTPCDLTIEPDPGAKFPCMYCGRSFSGAFNLNRHYKTCKMVKSKHSLVRKAERAEEKIKAKMEAERIRQEIEDEVVCDISDKGSTKTFTEKSKTHYVYLLQEREFIKTGEQIYKIGRTEKANCRRFNQYPKGSILLFQIICNDCYYVEDKIVELFKVKFKQRKDIGKEYFEGNYKVMINEMYKIVDQESPEDDFSSFDETFSSGDELE